MSPASPATVSIQTINVSGYSFKIAKRDEEPAFWKLLLSGKWEPNTYLTFKRCVNPKKNYLDIGAWIGPTVLFGAQLANHCYAIEANPNTFGRLVSNIELNPSVTKKVTPLNYCLTTQNGTVLFGSPSQFSSDTSSRILSRPEKYSWEVPGISFDSLLKEAKIENIGFIKMDIEGAEASVLPTMTEFLEVNRPTLLLSVHPPFFKNRKQDWANILKVLDLYPYIYTDSGRRINNLHAYVRLRELFRNKLFGNPFYAILATTEPLKL